MSSVLFISMEFADPIFSGNGVLARTYATEMISRESSHNHNVNRLDVLCAYPNDHLHENNFSVQSGWIDKNINNNHDIDRSDPIFVAIPVPSSKWRKLDINGPYREFAEGTTKFLESESTSSASSSSTSSKQSSFLSSTKSAFDNARRRKQGESFNAERTTPSASYDFVFIIDWHGFCAWKSILEFEKKQNSEINHHNASTRVVFLNFRIFANKLLLPPAEELVKNKHLQEEFEFYKHLEVDAFSKTHATFVLSDVDRKLMFELANNEENDHKSTKQIQVLMPPLQVSFLKELNNNNNNNNDKSPMRKSVTSVEELLSINKSGGEEVEKTFLLSCCVRLDPTKNADAFADLVVALAKRNNANHDCFSLVRSPKYPRARLIPFLCGAAANAEYAATVKDKIRKASALSQLKSETATSPKKFIIREDFVTSKELIDIWNCSALNVHPCITDAYGMSVVESGASGCLTLTHGERKNPEIATEKIDGKSSEESQPTSCSSLPGSWSTQVGACGLLQHENGEVVLADFTSPSEIFAKDLEPFLIQCLERCCEVSAASEDFSEETKVLNEMTQKCRRKSLSYGPTEAVKLLFELSN